MPKLTQKEAIQLLAAAGVQAVEIVEEGSDFNLETSLSAIDAERSKIIRPQIETEITDKVKSDLMGRAAGSLRAIIKRNFQIDAKELEGLNDEEMIKKAVEKHDSKFSKDTEQLREELKAKDTVYAQRETALKAEKDTLESQWKEKYFDREIKDAILKDLENSPLPKGVNKPEISELLKKMAKDEVHLVINDKTGEIEPRTKDNIEMPVYNDTKTSTIKLADITQKNLKKLGLWETDMRNQNPAEAMKKSQQSDYIQPNNKAAQSKDFNSEMVAILEAKMNE
jgi:hypothetical protein